MKDHTLVNVVPISLVLVDEAWSTRDLGLLVDYCDQPECIHWNATKFLYSLNLSYFVTKSSQNHKIEKSLRNGSLSCEYCQSKVTRHARN